MSESKQIVCLASTMRSGSTLLKALLAEADDVSNLSEVNFQKYSKGNSARIELEKLTDRSIVLLKRPAWYNETALYPQLPAVDKLKVILLVRDVYDTVQSCRKMTFRAMQKFASPLVDRRIANNYWLPITASLLKLDQNENVETRLIRYEDLIANPIDETAKLFRFIGSKQTEGIEEYGQPENYKWRWGRDDGSPNIRSLKVQRPRNKPQSNSRLLNIINASDEIVKIRQHLRYAVTDKRNEPVG